jgi:site-specific DNA-methyltransferase (adenine-specific)
MVEFVKLEDVTEDNRQRTFYDEMKIVELADDIAANGLLHAPVLRSDSDTLVVGGRRVRAIATLHRKGRSYHYAGVPVPEGTVPVTRAHSRDATGWAEAELSENLQREPLSWQEHAAAVKALHALRTSQNPTQTIKQTASEIAGKEAEGSAANAISQDLTLAEVLNDPEIAKAKSKKEALKILETKKRAEHNLKLAEQFKLGGNKSSHTLIHEDACSALSDLPNGTYQQIISDPPYGIGANTFGNQAALSHQYNDEEDHVRELMSCVLQETYRVAAGEAHAYFFCDIRHWPSLAAEAKSQGWYVWATPLIWYKGNQGLLPRPNHGPRRTYEAILYCIKGDKELAVPYHDVISIDQGTSHEHAAQKPVELYEFLLRRSARPGDHVLDPFAGSGTIFPAADRCQCIATGIELDPVNVGIASTKL